MKSINSSALSVFSSSKTREHRLWVERGFTGEGRIIEENLSLSLPEYFGGNELSRIRLVNCSIRNSHIGSSSFNEAELVNCDWSNCDLSDNEFNNAIIQNCTFYNTEYSSCKFTKAQIEGGDWSSGKFDSPYFTKAKITEVNLANSLIRKALLHKTEIKNCNFQNTDLAFSVAYFAVWENCDFRGVSFENFQFKNTILKNCGFYNCGGVPQSIEGIKIINPDLSENFDGNNIVDQQTIIEQWQQPVSQFIREKYQQREAITLQKQQDQKEQHEREIERINEEEVRIKQKLISFYNESFVDLYNKFIRKYDYLINNNLVEEKLEIEGDENATIQGREKITEITEEFIEMYNDLVDDEYIDGEEETTETLYYFVREGKFSLLIEALNPQTTNRYKDYEVIEQDREFYKLYNDLADLYIELKNIDKELAEEEENTQDIKLKVLEQLQQELRNNRKQIKNLQSQLKKTEERIENDRRTNIFGRKQSGNDERERDRLTQEIESTKARIKQNESLLETQDES